MSGYDMDPWSRKGLLDIGALRNCVFMQTADTTHWTMEDWEALIASVGTQKQVDGRIEPHERS